MCTRNELDMILRKIAEVYRSVYGDELAFEKTRCLYFPAMLPIGKQKRLSAVGRNSGWRVIAFCFITIIKNGAQTTRFIMHL